MRDTFEQQIGQAEADLLAAMRSSDVAALDALIAPELIFTSHFGQLMDKAADLELHRSGALRFSRLDPAEMRSVQHGDTALVSVRLRMAGQFHGQAFEADLRFTRVWRQAGAQGWRLIAAHSSPIQG